MLALMGGVLIYLCWLALFGFLWMPYWQEISRRGMYFHDIAGTYLVGFGPIIMAILFMGVGSLVALLEARRVSHVQRPLSGYWLAVLFGTVPTLSALVLINGANPDRWRFPLSETAVCLSGMALAYSWAVWRRR